MTTISFRPLTEDDLPLVHRWFHTGDVLRWYSMRPHTLEEVRARYLPNIRGEVPTRAFVVLFDGRAGGFIKTYLIADYSEYEAALGAEPGWAGIDYFIGEDDLRHRGLGAPMIEAFLRDVVFADERVTACASGPHPDNRASWRVLERAGFHFMRDVPTPGDAVSDGDGEVERLMVRSR
jgi:RimJ/RimL family protein N-acetyltransferase